MMYLMPLAFIALIVWAIYFNKGAEDEKMKAKGFIKVSLSSKPELGTPVKLQAKSGSMPKKKYPKPLIGGRGISVKPETYALFEVDGELIWVPESNVHQILSFEQGIWFKPNLYHKDVKFTYVKGENQYGSLL